MSLPETVFDVLGELITEVLIKHILHPCFKHIGTAIQWPFLFNRYTYRQIYNRPHNAAIGIAFIGVTLSITLGIAIYRHTYMK